MSCKSCPFCFLLNSKTTQNTLKIVVFWFAMLFSFTTRTKKLFNSLFLKKHTFQKFAFCVTCKKSFSSHSFFIQIHFLFYCFWLKNILSHFSRNYLYNFGNFYYISRTVSQKRYSKLFSPWALSNLEILFRNVWTKKTKAFRRTSTIVRTVFDLFLLFSLSKRLLNILKKQCTVSPFLFVINIVVKVLKAIHLVVASLEVE